jgi:hypothetical protein
VIKVTLTKNQKLVLKALRNEDNWKPSMVAIRTETGIFYNKSIIRAYRSLIKKKLIDKKLRLLPKELKLDMSGSTIQ